ncbi:MAG: hypothetical protein LBF22_08920 [Deltaproteobacteria bacterium]|jgi:hypothetical protein|nr:hypothetical protein [Deltaproteobacteria bacterium]
MRLVKMTVKSLGRAILVLLVTANLSLAAISTPREKERNFKDLQGTLTKTVDRYSVQTELPLLEEPTPLPKPISPSGWSSEILLILFYLLTGGGLSFLAIMFFRYFKTQKLTAKKKDLAKNTKPTLDRKNLEVALKSIQEDALAYAKKGLYTQAIHILLLNTLEEYKKRDPQKMPPFFTSRELVQVLPLTQEEDLAFRDLVFRVEVSYFGNVSPDKPDFLAAQASFDKLLKSLKTKPISPGKVAPSA